MAELSGQSFAGYEIIAKLGEGGFGAVYKARQPALNRLVALKILAPHLAADAEFVARFKREATLAASFNHPNLVLVYAAGESDGSQFMAMEFVEGKTLGQHIERQGRLQPREALAITVYVAQALQYAWNKSHLIHRDIKPDNIFVSVAGEIKVGDLGLAKNVGQSTAGMTATGMMMGSPHYISPEQAGAKKDIDFHADIYSLGCTLYQMLTGRTPYEGNDPMVVMGLHVNAPPPAMFKVWPQCPMPLALLVGKMLKKNPRERHASYEELIAELTAVHGKLTAAQTASAAPPSGTITFLFTDIEGSTQLWEKHPQAMLITLERHNQILRRTMESHGGFVFKTVGDAFCVAFASAPNAMAAALAAQRALAAEPWGETGPLRVRMALHTGAAEERGGDYFGPTLNRVARVLAAGHGGQVLLSNATEQLVRDHLAEGVSLGDLGERSLKNLTRSERIFQINLADMPTQFPTLRAAAAATPTPKFVQQARRSPAMIYGAVGAVAIALVAGLLLWSPWKTSSPIRNSKSEIQNSARPVDDAFVREVAALPAEKQVARVAAKLKELNPGFDGRVEPVIANNKVVELKFCTVDVANIAPVNALQHLRSLTCEGKYSLKGCLEDLSPLRGLKLEEFRCLYNPVSDLNPLKGMPLTCLFITRALVRDLAPLTGMPLTKLNLNGTPIADLSPLIGAPLQILYCNGSRVSDLLPLKEMRLTSLSVDSARVTNLDALRGMPLEVLGCDFVPNRDTEILRSIKTLKTINKVPAAEFWKQVEAGKITGSGRSTASGDETSGVMEAASVGSAFFAEVAALPGEDQVARVVAKLKELNPGYDGQETHKIEDGQVAEIRCLSTSITNISPFRALTTLSFLGVGAGNDEPSPIADLSPLQGLQLKMLSIVRTRITDLSPLRGMKLLFLGCQHTDISDLSPLRGMPLNVLFIRATQVSDLSPLEGMPLRDLSCQRAKITDLSVLRTTPIRILDCDFVPERDTKILRTINTLQKINGVPVADFWKRVEAGDVPQSFVSLQKPKNTPPSVMSSSVTVLKQQGNVFTNSVGAEMVYIPPGEFLLGSTKEEQAWAATNVKEVYVKREGEAPRKTRIKDGFWMGRTEVTVGQWKQFAKETGHVTDGEKNGESSVPQGAGNRLAMWGMKKGVSWRDPNFGFEMRDDHPVSCISWNDAVAFCEWLTERERKAGRLTAGQGVRLPTEAEWEYACRAGTQTKFWWGESSEDGKGRLNWLGNAKADGFEFVAPVDSFGARGRNGFGLADMLGNVSEWCLDEFDMTQAHENLWTGYPRLRVLRGGSYNYGGPGNMRCASRHGLSPSSSICIYGFRVAAGLSR